MKNLLYFSLYIFVLYFSFKNINASILYKNYSEPSLKTSSELLKVDSELRNILQKNGSVNIIVAFKRGTREVLEAVSDTRFPTREDRLIALNDALVENSRITQNNLIDYLGFFPSFKFKTFWITNEMLIIDADKTMVENIALFPEVDYIFQEPNLDLDAVNYGSSKPFTRRSGLETVEWGIQKIQAVEAVEHLNDMLSIKQQSPNTIRVAIIDTGVRHTHEALKDNYLGDFGWYDPSDHTQEPYDNVGHGTHVTGVICGKDGIGVFPNATWLACKGCHSMRCAYSALIECGQFTICPTSPDGLTRDCSKAPHVVSNSWSSFRGNSLFDGMILAWHVASIIPVASIGNTGPQCDSSRSPGERMIIGVGSTTVNDEISAFSSKGPSANGKMKPDITSPGSNIVSAYHTADDAYIEMSGTSFSCPMISGICAILLAYNEELNYERVLELLASGAETLPLQWDGQLCNGQPGNIFPNPIFGAGRANALKSLQALTSIQ